MQEQYIIVIQKTYTQTFQNLKQCIVSTSAVCPQQLLLPPWTHGRMIVLYKHFDMPFAISGTVCHDSSSTSTFTYPIDNAALFSTYASCGVCPSGVSPPQPHDLHSIAFSLCCLGSPLSHQSWMPLCGALWMAFAIFLPLTLPLISCQT